MSTPRPEFMTIAEFCQRYGVSPSFVYRLAGAGKLKLRKLGAATRIRVADAQAWAESLPDFESKAHLP